MTLRRAGKAAIAVDCVIKGTVTAKEYYNEDGTVQRFEWAQADEEVHIVKELLESADPAGLAFLKAKYEIGEECPYDRSCVHARLREMRP